MSSRRRGQGRRRTGRRRGRLARSRACAGSGRRWRLARVRVRVRVGARVGVRVRVRVEVRATVRVWVRAAVGGTEALRRQALEVREGHRLRADQRPVVQHGSAYRLSKARPTRVSSRPRPAWGPACSSGVRARVAYVPLHPLSHSAERQVACGLAHDAHGPRVARVGQRLRRRRAGQEGLLQQRRRLPGMQGKRSAAAHGLGARQVGRLTRWPW